MGSEVPLFAKNEPLPEKRINKTSSTSDCTEKGKLFVLFFYIFHYFNL